ncbi:Nitrogen permease regulator 3 [Rhodotorula kratochvilovae]
MASLLAVVLVAKSSLGAQLVYTYPPAPRTVPRTHKPVYSASRRQRALYGAHTSSSSSDSGSDSSDDADDRGPDSKHFLGFSDNVLASLLSPSRELCDQPFELVVDHLAFVGHPVWLGDDEGPRERAEEPKPERGGSDGGSDEEDEEGDTAGARGRSRQPRYADLKGLVIEDELEAPALERDRTIGPPASRNASAPPRPMLIAESASPSPTRPSTLARSQSSTSTLHPGSSLASSQHSHNSLAGSTRLVSFNFLCVIDTPPDSHLSSHLEGFYKDVIIPITANIKALEKKDLWLGKEAAKLRRAREVAIEKDDPYDAFLHSLPARSALAGALSQLYTSLKAEELAEIHLGPLPVQVLLRGELPAEDDLDMRERDAILLSDQADDDLSPAGRRERSLSPGGHAHAKSRPPPLFSRMRRRPPVHFQPWETLLLLEDARVLQRDVLEGSLLWRFLEICRPTLSFAEYETLLDLDSEDQLLEDVVDHLVHWKKARVVDLISLKGSYAVSAGFKPARLPALTASFAAAFPSFPPLAALLSRLSPTDPFAAIIPPSQRSLYLTALIWLLRHQVVDKQRTYVRVIASETIKRATAAHWSGAQSGVSGAGTSGTGAGPKSAASGAEDAASVLGTSASGASDRSFGSAYRHARQASRSGGGGEDDEAARGMAVVSGGADDSPLSTSASMHARAVRCRRAAPAQRAKGLSTATYSSHSERMDETNMAPSVIIEPGRPSMLESRWISEMCRDQDKAVVDKFERIIRMLNGRHHLDEIRFRAQLSRKHLSLVLSAFEEHLILFTHP